MENQCLEGLLKHKINYTCNNCIWKDECGGLVPCSDHDSTDEDEYIEEFIKARRFEFGQDWQEYVRGWN